MAQVPVNAGAEQPSVACTRCSPRCSPGTGSRWPRATDRGHPAWTLRGTRNARLRGNVGESVRGTEPAAARRRDQGRRRIAWPAAPVPQPDSSKKHGSRAPQPSEHRRGPRRRVARGRALYRHRAAPGRDPPGAVPGASVRSGRRWTGAPRWPRASPAPGERGIVHRDLKPENIFVTRDGPA